jgi:hypothetical protein
MSGVKFEIGKIGAILKFLRGQFEFFLKNMGPTCTIWKNVQKEEIWNS